MTRPMVALSLALLLPALGTSSANVALPTLAEAFQAPFQAVQWVVVAYLLAVTALVVGAGRLGDLVGQRRLLVAGTLLYSCASFLCAVAPSLGWLIAARALQGLGAAAMMALTLAIAGATFPGAQLGRAMGLLGSMSAAGTALGPSLGGALVAGAGWPALFLVNVPLGLLTALLVRWHLPADRAEARPDFRRFDLLGTLLLALTLAAYTLAMTVAGAPFGAPSLALLVVAAIGLGCFLHVELNAEAPLVRVQMLRDRALRAGLAVSMGGAVVVMASLVVGPFYLAGAFGLDPLQVGLVLSVGPLVAALAGVPAGRLVERHGAPRMVLAGLGAMAAGALWLALPGALGVPGYVAPLVLLTAGYALVQAANNAAVMAAAPADRRGVVSGMLNLSRNLGLLTGASVLGAVFAAAAEPADVSAGLRATFLVAAALLLGALALAARSRQGSPVAAGVAP